MHWTAFLAYRRVPANAQVIGDLGCIHCGYNVRGLRASGLCPECGSRIAESLTLLAKPDVVAQSLRSFSNSFFALLITVIGCVGGMAGWQAIVTSAVLAASALNRSWNASELKFRAQLGNSEKLMSRATVLWWITLVETLIALGWFAGVLATVYVPSLQTAASANFVMNIAALWLVAMLGSAAAAGWLGAACSDSAAKARKPSSKCEAPSPPRSKSAAVKAAEELSAKKLATTAL